MCGADVFKEDFADVPKNLKKLKKSYEMCGDALADFDRVAEESLEYLTEFGFVPRRSR